jgi:hypothetical protein
MNRASRPKFPKLNLRYPSTSVAASSSPRCSSLLAWRVTARLTMPTATAIDTTASSAVAKKMRFVSDEKRFIGS